MEGNVAHWYDARVQHERDEYCALAHRIGERLPSKATVIEVAPEPGYLSIELAKLGDHAITGLDISETFVALASKNAQREGVTVDFRHGDVGEMPFQEGTFDFIVCRAAFQNFSEPARGLQEMRRVLKAGGTAVVIELRRDVSSRTINQHLRKVTKGVMDWFTNQLVFRLLLTRRAYTQSQLLRFATAGGFPDAQIREGPMFLELWLSKTGT
jgi:ubiquinone/menaquinone biosynthesis C-methylase UbiE